MKRTKTVMSTRLTIPFKGVGMVLPILAGLLLMAFFRYLPVSVWTIAAAMPTLLVCPWLCWCILRLGHVAADDEGVEARVLWKVIRVRYNDIVGVTSHHALAVFITTLPLVTIRYRGPQGSVEKIRHIARFTLKGWQKGAHPDVLFLQAKCGVTRRQ
jgi:hypothetical protein